MPWLTIIMTLVSFFFTKKKTGSNTKAALAAGLVGAGTYYVTHETEWGVENLGSLDGVGPAGAATGRDLTDVYGNAVKDANGKTIKTTVPVDGSTTSSSTGKGIADVLTSWGATGTAAVIGTTAASTGSGVFKGDNLPWLIGGGALLLFLFAK